MAKIQREEEQSRVNSTKMMNPVIMDGSTTVLTQLGREDSQSAPACPHWHQTRQGQSMKKIERSYLSQLGQLWISPPHGF